LEDNLKLKIDGEFDHDVDSINILISYKDGSFDSSKVGGSTLTQRTSEDKPSSEVPDEFTRPV